MEILFAVVTRRTSEKAERRATDDLAKRANAYLHGNFLHAGRPTWPTASPVQRHVDVAYARRPSRRPQLIRQPGRPPTSQHLLFRALFRAPRIRQGDYRTLASGVGFRPAEAAVSGI
jgi:hypothetical protein